MKVKSSLVILLSILMVPVAQSHLQQVPDLTPAAIVGETLVGFGLGLGAALLMGAAESAGELLSIQIGLSGSAILDPLTQQQTTALGQLVHLFDLPRSTGTSSCSTPSTSVQRLPSARR
jgi:flagellar biosynthetic protein FliR